MKNVLCFGDSNTFGFNPNNATRFDKNSRWSGILRNLCREDFHIIEAGCNNRTAFSDNSAGKMFTGYKILPELLNQKLDFVVLAIGINDLQFQYNVSLEEIKSGISSLVDIVKTNVPRAKLILVAPTELTESVLKSPIFSTLFDETSIEKSKMLSKIYFEIAKNKNCDFIDLNTVAIPSKVDGLHFEASGHEKIAKKIFKHLN